MREFTPILNVRHSSYSTTGGRDGMSRSKPSRSRHIGYRVQRAGGTAPAVHRTIMVVDVEGFGDPRRTGVHQVGVRDGLYRCLERAFSRVGIPWADCYDEDRGDGVLLLAPAELPKSRFVELLPGALVEALTGHNENHPTEQRIRLRVALHAGEIRYDRHGVTGAAINLAFRLLDAAPLKSALATSPGVLALVVSSWFFDEVVRDSPASEPAHYSRATVVVK